MATTVTPLSWETPAELNVSRTELAFKRLGAAFEQLMEDGRMLDRHFSEYVAALADTAEVGFEGDPSRLPPWILHGLSVWKTEQTRLAANLERKAAR